jgi:uncharacterized protein YjbI with pentapeptide repeats
MSLMNLPSNIRLWWNGRPISGFFHQVNELLRSSEFVTFLEYAGRFTVVIAVVTWLAECPDRRQERQRQAWQVVHATERKPYDGGRGAALELLVSDGQSLQGIDLQGVGLPGVNLRGAKLGGANLNRANLRRAILREADLEGARIEGIAADSACLIGAYFRNAGLVGGTYFGADLQRALFWSATLQAGDDGNTPVVMDSANFTRADFRLARIQGVHFLNANLRDADFRGAALLNTDFEGADLKGAEFSGATLDGVSFHAVVNWEAIGSMNLAILHDIRGAPEAFVQWAKERGGIEAHPDSLDWTTANARRQLRLSLARELQRRPRRSAEGLSCYK